MTGEPKTKLVYRGPFYAQLWESVLFDKNLNPSAIVVYATLQRFAGEQGSDAIFPAKQEIADRCHLSRPTVDASLKLLKENGHILCEKEGRGWVVTLIDPRDNVKNIDVQSGRGVKKTSTRRKESLRTDVKNFDESEGDTSKERIERGETPLPPKNGGSDAPTDLDEERSFREFWATYTKGRGSKKLSREQWHKMSAADRQACLAVLPEFVQSHDWQREGGRYVKHAQRWLRDRGWENDVPPAPVGFHEVGLQLQAMQEERRGEAGNPGEYFRYLGHFETDPDTLLAQLKGHGTPRHGDDGVDVARGAERAIEAGFRVGPS